MAAPGGSAAGSHRGSDAAQDHPPSVEELPSWTSSSGGGDLLRELAPVPSFPVLVGKAEGVQSVASPVLDVPPVARACPEDPCPEDPCHAGAFDASLPISRARREEESEPPTSVEEFPSWTSSSEAEDPCHAGAFDASLPVSRARHEAEPGPPASMSTAPADEESDYDPIKPEYTRPASSEDVTRGLRSQRARQLGRLQAAVARRTAKGDPRALELCKHYSKVAQELKAGLVTPQSTKEQCPVCLESTGPARRLLLVTLQCGHPLCCGCAVKCAASGLSSCPVCRHPHLLDPGLLSSRKEQWRRQYSRWRAGKSRGAAGEVSSVCEPAAKTGPFPDRPAADAGRNAATLDVLAWTASLDRTAAHPVITFPGAGDLSLARLAPLVQAPRGRVLDKDDDKAPRAAPRTARAGGAAGCWGALGCLFA